MREVLAHGCPPCKARRADVIRVHRRPARVVTIAMRPSSMGRVAETHTPFPNFGKAEYFCRQMLPYALCVLPVRQRKVLWSGNTLGDNVN